ncbi:MAG: helix-turn-helix transcriptional regulator [Pyrinomonadaceae bacterium]|nr:helix-turn-helix transcriptional regulator [Pyrinomonadaceae bacterium]
MATVSHTTVCRDYTIESRYRTVERVIRKMQEQLDEPFSLKEMAEVAYLSPFHFNRVFHQITGIPPTQFLYALRLEAAKRLLLTTHLRVTDVCYEVGYNSLGTFTTRFTQLVGLSPCQLRRLPEHSLLMPTEATGDSRLPLPAPTSSGSWIEGKISAPEPDTKAIFVGLFRMRIPQGRPVAGAFLTSPGKYRMGPLPDGRYYLFAAALPDGTGPLTYLLPNIASMLVGGGQGSLVVKGGKVSGKTDLNLRPVRLTDPPILIALPSLLAGQLHV